MKILVIGGSYFFGRVFVMQAVKEHEVTVVNRGTYSMEAQGARQMTGDRRDARLWAGCQGAFDAIVDFCGYEQGDIRTVLEGLSATVRQYIFISTVDVYPHGGTGLRDERAPLGQDIPDGEAGQYIAGKIALEQELVSLCREKGIEWTILRPSILYGPYNYAPRESVFIRMMVQEHVLPHIVDAPGQFQLVYVKDAAEAILRCLLREEAYGQAFNICNEAVMDYHMLFGALRDAADVPVREILMKVEEALGAQIPLMFPLSQAEMDLCSSRKSRELLGMQYTDAADGMAKTYRAFKDVYELR